MTIRIFIGTALISTSALAAPSDCFHIQKDIDRLACYDREHGRTPEKKDISSTESKWSVRQETSKITDDTNVYMTLESEETVNCGWNKGGKVYLVVRCRENTTSMYFRTGCHMTSSDYTNYGEITYRLDRNKAQKLQGKESTDNRALGLWRGSESIPVIKEMFDKSSLIVRMTPYSENPFMATFDIKGIEKEIAALRQSCNW